jgi:hypothetical protein
MFHHLQHFHIGECYFREHGGMWKVAVMPCFVLVSHRLCTVIKTNSEAFVRVAACGLRFKRRTFRKLGRENAVRYLFSFSYCYITYPQANSLTYTWCTSYLAFNWFMSKWGWSRWLHSLRRKSAAARLLRLRVRILQERGGLLWVLYLVT